MSEKGIVIDDSNMDISDPKMIDRARAWFDEQDREIEAEAKAEEESKP